MINPPRTGLLLGSFRPAALCLCIMSLVLASGCPGLFDPPDDNNGTDPPNGDNGDPPVNGIEAEIVTPSTTLGLSVLEMPISVRYSVSEAATDIEGYYIPVDDAVPDSPASGERIYTANNLDPGENQTFAFDPRAARVGFFRVGIAYFLDDEEASVESSAVIEVEGAPDPIFILPVDDITEVVQGGTAPVSFDARDPQGEVQWRLFILSETDSWNDPPDTIGSQLDVGIGNVGTYSLTLDDLAPGDYSLGVSATDSGYSVAATVARGETGRIVTIPVSAGSTPTIRVLAAD